MRILLGFLLLAAAAAWAEPDGQDREIAAAKEKLQAMLDEATLLEKGGRAEEAAKVREEAAALKKKIEAARGGSEERDDPRVVALRNMEKAIGALDKAGYESMARDLRGMADHLRREIKGAGGQERPGTDDMDFIRRNMDTLRIAMKGLAEAEKHDAADAMDRAIHAREVLLESKGDDMARAMKGSPGDGDVAELLSKAAGCWREFKQPENAEKCEELGRFYRQRVEMRKQMEDAARTKVKEPHDGPGPDDRMARIEERLDRVERMLHETLERLEQRERAEK